MDNIADLNPTNNPTSNPIPPPLPPAPPDPPLSAREVPRPAVVSLIMLVCRIQAALVALCGLCGVVVVALALLELTSMEAPERGFLRMVGAGILGLSVVVTVGWVAALVCAALSLRNRSQVAMWVVSLVSLIAALFGLPREVAFIGGPGATVATVFTIAIGLGSLISMGLLLTPRVTEWTDRTRAAVTTPWRGAD